MRRFLRVGCLCVLSGTGCASVPPVENPTLVQADSDKVENPVLVSPGLPTPGGYAEVYERVLTAVNDYFDIKPGSRYAGQIETYPRVAPGYEQFWKPGSPDRRERLLATFQTIRHIATVRIWAGERGGYRVYVEVVKQLEDLNRPIMAVAGAATFRENPTVDRRMEVVGAVAPPEKNWIPVGRDPALEQVILRKIQAACR